SDNAYHGSSSRVKSRTRPAQGHNSLLPLLVAKCSVLRRGPLGGIVREPRPRGPTRQAWTTDGRATLKPARRPDPPDTSASSAMWGRTPPRQGVGKLPTARPFTSPRSRLA